MILHLILDQAATMAAIGARLGDISLATPLDAADCPILRIGWRQSGGAPDRRANPESGVVSQVMAPAMDQRLALPQSTPESLDAAFLEVSWALGAWDVSRMERLPLAPDADPMQPGHGITHLVAFPYRCTGIPEEDAPVDIGSWVRACARHGWLHWSCRPMWMVPEMRQKAWLAKDRTLRQDGSREERQWQPWEPVVIGSNHQTIIRLGKANHGNR